MGLVQLWLEEKEGSVVEKYFATYGLTAPILISTESGTGCLFKKVKQLLVIKNFMPAFRNFKQMSILTDRSKRECFQGCPTASIRPR